MNWDKKNLATSIIFFIFSIICISCMAKQGLQSYLAIGTVLFLFVGVAFFKRSKK